MRTGDGEVDRGGGGGVMGEGSKQSELIRVKFPNLRASLLKAGGQTDRRLDGGESGGTDEQIDKDRSGRPS